LPREIDFCAHAIWRAFLSGGASGAHKSAADLPWPSGKSGALCISLLPLGRAVGRLKFSEN
jgi:hypothetical protein